MLLAEGDFFIKKWMKNKRVANIYGRKWAWLMLRGMEAMVSMTLNLSVYSPYIKEKDEIKCYIFLLA